jgi:hypothetical protein
VELTIHVPKIGSPKQEMATLSKRNPTNLIKWHCFMETIVLNKAARVASSGKQGPALVVRRAYVQRLCTDFLLKEWSVMVQEISASRDLHPGGSGKSIVALKMMWRGCTRGSITAVVTPSPLAASRQMTS